MTIFDSLDQNITDTGSTIGNPYGFTGRRWDQETGLWYYRNRMYSPTLGRFMQRDPEGYVDGMNLYAYVKNNPLRWLDPWGFMTNQQAQQQESAFWSIVSGVGQAVVGGVTGTVQAVEEVRQAAPTMVQGAGQGISRGVEGGAYALGEAGKFVGRGITPSKHTLNVTMTTATVLGTASVCSANVPATITFAMIGGSAKLLKSMLYGGSPYNSVAKEAAKQAVPAPPGLGPIKDEIVERSLDWYIQKHDLPEM